MSFDFNNPYSSARTPIFARNIVATSHPQAAQAGLKMLQSRGNAVDAAVATAAAMTILEPVSNGLGSDAFCIVWDGNQLHGLNASGRAPKAWTPDYFRSKYGAGDNNPPKRGLDAVTVPGAVSSWAALSSAASCHSPILWRQPSKCRARLLRAAHRSAKWVAPVDELRSQPGFAQAFLPVAAPQVANYSVCGGGACVACHR